MPRARGWLARRRQKGRPVSRAAFVSFQRGLFPGGLRHLDVASRDRLRTGPCFTDAGPGMSSLLLGALTLIQNLSGPVAFAPWPLSSTQPKIV